MLVSIIDNLPKSEIYNDLETGLKLSYRFLKNNNKKTIVFFHGYNGNSKSWVYQFKYFRHDYSLISFDFPGFGKSELMINSDMYKVSELIIRALQNLKIMDYYIVGHSMGGMLAQVLSTNKYSSIIKMVLSCTHKGYSMKYKKPLREPYNKRLQERSELSDVEYGKLRISKMLPGFKDEKIFNFLSSISQETSKEAIICGGSSMQILDTTNILPYIKVPCLILTGSEDVVVSKEKSLFLHKSIKNSTHFEIKGVGHAPYCEKAKEFNEVINSFLISE